MNSRRRRPLLELDPDLGRLLDPARLECAGRELDVELRALEAGPWEVGGHEPASSGHLGLLLVEGVVSREVIVADTVSIELLGPGDVVRPWSLKPAGELLRLDVRWTCLVETRVALLDRHFASRLARWPEVNTVIIDRLNDRSQRLATTQAISQLTRVDRRLLALFWHLAERWGRVTSGGVCVPLTLSHRMLGQLIGARRQTVSAALGELARHGELLRREDHTWLLAGDPVGASSAAAHRVIPTRRALVPAMLAQAGSLRSRRPA
jgi:CRP/FNR family transcriptional regulator, cyclic AMP receptor protein